ncbi:MAG: NAD-dependent deacylase [Spirochaetales bacterium]|nr:NAD-dependent deacylase [Spirochaetales bacterium]
MPYDFPSIVILTGAGISAESGLQTFRGDTGLWEDHRVEDVATVQGFHRNPSLVYEFYNARRRQLQDVTPNGAHDALAQLEAEYPGSVTLITQNIDDLHERAGSQNVVHMHGQASSALCSHCGARCSWKGDMKESSLCSHCQRAGGLRPDIVWFGEIPYEMERIEKALEACGIFVSIGTSGNVYPAAGFVNLARQVGAHRVELNLEATSGGAFDEGHYGLATQVVPSWVKKVLSR